MTQPFLKGMQEVTLSEVVKEWSVASNPKKSIVIAEPSPERDKPEEAEEDLIALLAWMDECIGKITEKIKGKKGAPTTRQQMSMAKKLLFR